MNQMFDFSPSTTVPFLRYAENAHFVNEKVLHLIEDLRAGLSEEKQLQEKEQQPDRRLYFQRQKNIMTCYCILLHVQCLADLSENDEQYVRFLDGWNSVLVLK